MERFEQVIPYVLKAEGGYTNDAADAGGPTNYGIIQSEYSTFLGHPATIDDMKSMPLVNAIKIYKAKYWDAMKLDLFSDFNIQLILMDQGVNRGTKTAMMSAQVLMGSQFGKNLSVDGANGPATSGAINGVDPQLFSREYLQSAEHAYADICIRKNSQLVFLHGWLNRVHNLQDVIWNQGAVITPVIVPKPIEDMVVGAGKDILAPYHLAQKEIGVSEIVGSKNTARIVWYHSFTSLHATDDETPWCSSFMCAMAETAGFKSTKSAAAASWRAYGVAGDGSVGDIAVFPRVGGNHVAFVNKKYSGGATIEVLGGNQANKVCVTNHSTSGMVLRRFQA